MHHGFWNHSSNHFQQYEFSVPEESHERWQQQRAGGVGERMLDAVDRTVTHEMREEPPDYYTAKATWFPEACRLFVNWWLHTFAFPKFYRKLFTPEEVESSIMYGNPRILIIDARRPDEYEESHLYGAVNISPFSNDFPQLTGVDKNTLIVCYCAIGLRSGWLAFKLYKKGFREARALDGGFYGWVNKGKPIYKDYPPRIVYQVKPQHFFAKLALKRGVKGDSRKLQYT